MNHEHDAHAGSGRPLCSACGQRPGTVRVLVPTDAGREARVLCETCMGQLMRGVAPGEIPVRGLPAHGGQTPPHGGDGEPQSDTPNLDGFGRDLTADAAAGRIDPVIGRELEIEQTIEILARRRKNNAVLIGEAGVGKTAIVEGLARRLAQADVPATLQGARLVALDLAGDGRRQPVPRPVRAAPEGRARRGRRRRGSCAAVRRRAAHRAGRRGRRRRDGRRQHAQADARPRRAADDRRHHAGRVPQDRARRRARASLLAGQRRGTVGR